MLKDQYNPRLCNLLLLLHRVPRFFNLGIRFYEFLLNSETVFTHDTSWEGLGLTEDEIRSLRALNWEIINKDLCWATQDRHHIITIYDDAYPQLLKEIPNPPLLLFVIGDIGLLKATQLAIVGSRNPTAGGCETAYMFGYKIAHAGLVITSGLARGIDAASHMGAVAATGKTIAVLGTGLEYIYPRINQSLAVKIIERGGVLISELPLTSKAEAWHFPLRNRIISGLSIGTLVVEATLRSGSLITARLAGEQGREIFAIPGSIYNGLACGCHHLIKQGAKLVERPADIIAELPTYLGIKQPPSTTSEAKEEKKKLDPLYKKLLDCIGYETVTVDMLVVRTTLTVQLLQVMLLELEMWGYIQVVAGQYTRIIDNNC